MCSLCTITVTSIPGKSMKNFFLSLAVLIALLLSLTIGASFFLKNTVEDTTKEAILSMAGPGETAIEDVRFSPLTREITITGWRTRHQTLEGPMSAHALTVHGTVTFRGILACMPVLGSLFNNADTYVPVLDKLRASNLLWTSADRRCSLSELELTVVRLRYNLLQQYLAGLRPPFAQSVTGIRVDEVEAVDCLLTQRAPLATTTIRAREADLRNVLGTCADRAVLRDVTVLENGQNTLDCRELTLEEIRVSPALLSELVAQTSPRLRSNKANSHLAEALLANGPLVSKATLRDVTDAQTPPSLTMEQCELLWTDNPPLSIETHVRGLSIASRELQAYLPVNWQGMETVQVEADLASSGAENNQQSGLVRLKNLGELSYSFIWHPTRTTLQDLTMTWRDYGFTVRLARTITPDAHAASMLLKTMSASLCRADAEKDREQCRRLGNFIDAPGTLTLRTAKGTPVSILEFLTLSGRFGSLFQVEVRPGSATLTQQSEELFSR